MSSSNYCFLTCIQNSQEAVLVVCYSHLFKNLPQFFVIHTVKCCGTVSKTEIDVLLELSCFFDNPVDIGNLISGSSAFYKSTWTSGSSRFKYCWSPAWRILSITFLVCEMSTIVHSLNILWDWNENKPFPVLWPLLSFPNLLAYWVQYFHSIIFYFSFFFLSLFFFFLVLTSL